MQLGGVGHVRIFSKLLSHYFPQHDRFLALQLHSSMSGPVDLILGWKNVTRQHANVYAQREQRIPTVVPDMCLIRRNKSRYSCLLPFGAYGAIV